MQSHRQSEFCANLMYHESDPGQAGYPTLKRLHGKIWPRLRGLPGLADRATRLGGSPHLSCKRDQIKTRGGMDRRVTSPTWGPPPPCKQALCAWELFCMRIKIIFISMVLHLASLWNRGFRQLGNDLLKNWSAYIYISYLGGNLVYKHKTIKFYLVGEQLAKVNQNQRTERT